MSLQIDDYLSYPGWFYLTVTSSKDTIHIYDFGLQESSWKSVSFIKMGLEYAGANHRKFDFKTLTPSIPYYQINNAPKIAMLKQKTLYIFTCSDRPQAISSHLADKDEFMGVKTTDLIKPDKE